MAASRATQFIALRNLSRGAQQVRKLHMTGPTSYASPVLTSQQPIQTLTQDTAQTSTSAPPTRHFNTTRPLKAVGDSSTIDFAYLPAGDFEPEEPEVYRVPILHNNYTKTSNAVEVPEPLMKPEISTMSADAVFLPMSDMHDGHAENVDFHAMADRVAANLKRMKVPIEEQAGLMKQLWNDIVDDMLAVGKKSPTT